MPRTRFCVHESVYDKDVTEAPRPPFCCVPRGGHGVMVVAAFGPPCPCRRFVAHCRVKGWKSIATGVVMAMSCSIASHTLLAAPGLRMQLTGLRPFPGPFSGTTTVCALRRIVWGALARQDAHRIAPPPGGRQCGSARPFAASRACIAVRAASTRKQARTPRLHSASIFSGECLPFLTAPITVSMKSKKNIRYYSPLSL